MIKHNLKCKHGKQLSGASNYQDFKEDFDHVIFTCLIEAMNEMLCVNMKVDQDSTFIFMQDLSAIFCIYLLGYPRGQHPI